MGRIGRVEPGGRRVTSQAGRDDERAETRGRGAGLVEARGAVGSGSVEVRAALRSLQRSAGNRAVVAVVQRLRVDRAEEHHEAEDDGRCSSCAESGGGCSACNEHALEVPVSRDVGQDPLGLGKGTALDAGTRSGMENTFGRDFSHVRVHSGAEGARAASSANARAFTSGSDIAFGSGEYQPGTPVGDALIAHEMAHVVQQTGTERGPRDRVTDDPQMDAEADLAAMQFLLGDGQASVRQHGGLGIQRCTPSVGGYIPASAFQFERVTGGGDPSDRSLPWYAACVNITLSHLGGAPRFQVCQFEVGFPGIHHRGITPVAVAQSAAAEAFNEAVPALLRSRSAECRTIAARVQSIMRRGGVVPGAKVNTPCLTKSLPITEWPTRH